MSQIYPWHINVSHSERGVDINFEPMPPGQDTMVGSSIVNMSYPVIDLTCINSLMILHFTSLTQIFIRDWIMFFLGWVMIVTT